MTIFSRSERALMADDSMALVSLPSRPRVGSEAATSDRARFNLASSSLDAFSTPSP
jgi:hypothetical protein